MKKRQRGHHRCPFISIYEGKILRDMEEIRRTHCGDIFMKILAIKLLTRHRNSRVQQTMVSYPWRASVDSNRIGMEKQHILHTEKDEFFHRLIRQPLQHRPVAFAQFFDGDFHALRTNSHVCRCDDQRVSIHRHLERRLFRDTERFHHRLFDDQGHAISMSLQRFNHGAPPVRTMLEHARLAVQRETSPGSAEGATYTNAAAWPEPEPRALTVYQRNDLPYDAPCRLDRKSVV